MIAHNTYRRSSSRRTATLAKPFTPASCLLFRNQVSVLTRAVCDIRPSTVARRQRSRPARAAVRRRSVLMRLTTRLRASIRCLLRVIERRSNGEEEPIGLSAYAASISCMMGTFGAQGHSLCLNIYAEHRPACIPRPLKRTQLPKTSSFYFNVRAAAAAASEQ